MNKKYTMILRRITLTLAIAFFSSGLMAQEAATDASAEKPTGKTAEELAKMSQNPLANMMSFPFQNNTNFGNGPDEDRTSNTFNIQPVLPFFDGHLITRTIIPISSSPNYTEASGANTGVGDINATLFYAPTPKNGLTWGIGPVFVIPTNSKLSSHKFSTGASFLALKMSKKFVYGFLVSNVWSVAGDDTYNDVNSFLGQYFINMNFAKGWYLSSAPIITANWKAADGQQWVVPFGGGGGKIIRIGKIPFNLQAQAFWNAVKPDNYGGISTRLQIQIMLPK